jgi:hypothetical protein
MEFTMLEVCLAVYGLAMTCFTAHYFLKFKQAVFVGLMMTRSLMGIAVGKVSVEINEEGLLKLTDLEDENGNPSKQDRQS